MIKRSLTSVLLLCCTATAHTESSKGVIQKEAKAFGGLVCQTYHHSDGPLSKPIPAQQLKEFYSNLVQVQVNKPGVKVLKQKVSQTATLFTGERLTDQAGAGRVYDRTEFDLKGGAALFKQTNSCQN